MKGWVGTLSYAILHSVILLLCRCLSHIVVMIDLLFLFPSFLLSTSRLPGLPWSLPVSGLLLISLQLGFSVLSGSRVSARLSLLSAGARPVCSPLIIVMTTFLAVRIGLGVSLWLLVGRLVSRLKGRVT
jgi:hypothetical protein